MFLISRLQIMALHNVVSKQFYRPQKLLLGQLTRSLAQHELKKHLNSIYKVLHAPLLLHAR